MTHAADPATSCDLLIIGGGIIGSGIAADAATRGARVILVEDRNLGSGASGYAQQLFTGGFDFLERGEWGLVRRCLQEQRILARRAPHLIRHVDCLLPHHPEGRSRTRLAWMHRLYRWLGARHFDARLSDGPFGEALRDDRQRWLHYHDCRILPGRLVISNALLATEAGATVLTHTRLTDAQRDTDGWTLTLRDHATGTLQTVRARALVNAAGRSVNRLLEQILGVHSRCRTAVIGSDYIVLPKPYPGRQVYTFQAGRRNWVQAVPLNEAVMIVGGLTRAESDLPDTQTAIAELCGVTNHYFRHRVRPDDVLHHIREHYPIFATDSDAAPSLSRQYLFDLNRPDGQAPLLTVFGGLASVYRLIAEQGLDVLAPYLSLHTPCRTRDSLLPGGDLPEGGLEALARRFIDTYPNLPPNRLTRYARLYGTRAEHILARIARDGSGRDFGHGLVEAEVRYLIEKEWACNADDILWHRTRLGFRFTPDERERFHHWLAAHG